MEEEPTIEEMKSELAGAGWVQESATVWRAPYGGLYRGPYGAWKALRGILRSQGGI